MSGHNLSFHGQVTSSVTWPFDLPYVISYWCPIGTYNTAADRQ